MNSNIVVVHDETCRCKYVDRWLDAHEKYFRPLTPLKNSSPELGSTLKYKPIQINSETTETEQLEKLKQNKVSPDTVQARTVKPTAVTTETEQPEKLKHNKVSPDKVQARTVKPTAVTTETEQPEKLKHNKVSPDTVQARTVKPTAVTTETEQPEKLKHNKVSPDTVQARTVKPTAIVHPNTVRQNSSNKTPARSTHGGWYPQQIRVQRNGLLPSSVPSDTEQLNAVGFNAAQINAAGSNKIQYNRILDTVQPSSARLRQLQNTEERPNSMPLLVLSPLRISPLRLRNSVYVDNV